MDGCPRDSEESGERGRAVIALLTLFSDDETAPTDTSDADGETATTAPPVHDDETLPLA